MWVFREPEPGLGEQALPFLIGAASGLAVGLLLSSRVRPDVRSLGRGIRRRARTAVTRIRPARQHRLVGEQTDLTALEDAVLDAFLADRILSERGIDIGAISRGIVELSGSVATEDEADHAVRLAGRVPGVATVVDRLEIEEESRHLDDVRKRIEDEDPSLTETRWGGRRVGMGRRRQGKQTDPDRPDDHQHQEDVALEDADRDEWVAENLASANPRMSERPDNERARQNLHFHEDELDNQDPHGKHAARTLDRPPQQQSPDARVAEPLKPGTELQLEKADVPVKPHSRTREERGSR